MSFNRLRYDPCECNQATKESQRAATYSLTTPEIDMNCFSTNPHIRASSGHVRYRNVDAESELRNITRPASRCPSQKYQPQCPNCRCINQGIPCGAGVIKCKTCNCKMQDTSNKKEDCYFAVGEQTRLDEPTCTLRGTGINRFQPLCFDPQENIFMPARTMEPTRMMARDEFKPNLPDLSIMEEQHKMAYSKYADKYVCVDHHHSREWRNDE